MVVPGAIPFTVPDVPTVAVVGTLLDQVPPGVPSVRVMLWPAQTADEPVIAATEIELTVTTAVAAQPVSV